MLASRRSRRDDETLLAELGQAEAGEAERDISQAKLRAVRIRNECGIPGRRRGICCCLCFWLALLFAILGAGALLAKFIPADGQQVAMQYEVIRRCGTEKNCRSSQARGLRSNLYPRVFDLSLADSSVSPCTNVYRHACGAWDDSHAGQALVPLTARDYHSNLLLVLEAALADRESVLYAFVHQHCRPLVTVVQPPRRDTPAQWLERQLGAQLPLWLTDVSLHTLCLLGHANAITPPWIYELTLGLTPSKAQSLSDRVARVTAALGTECSETTTSWLGALGDPFTAQIEWTAPAKGIADHATLHSMLASEYGHIWTAASALAPYTWLVVGEGRRAVLRIALPRDRKEWMQRSHCERIAAVVFVEVLEDRYTALVRRSRPEATLSGLTLCTSLEPPVSVTIVERPSQVRSDVWQCIQRQSFSNWHALAAVVAACNEGHRIQPDAPLLDAFVPSVESSADGRHLQITPALLQAPWFSDEMELPSVAARLYWTLLRAVAARTIAGSSDCSTEAMRDIWTLDVMGQCFRQLMDTQFWLELLQLHCGGPCSAERWASSVQRTPAFRRAYKCDRD